MHQLQLYCFDLLFTLHCWQQCSARLEALSGMAAVCMLQDAWLPHTCPKNSRYAPHSIQSASTSLLSCHWVVVLVAAGGKAMYARSRPASSLPRPALPFGPVLFASIKHVNYESS
jgi:hypothetical protein